MKMQLFLVVMSFLLCSCESEDNIISITMQDGNTITLNSSQKYYSNEEEFIHCVSFSFPRSYECSEIEYIDYLDDSEYIVEGCNQFFIGGWEIARFGEWIRNYGLNPNESYYVATKVYAKYLSKPPVGLRIVPKLGGTFMGYCPDIEARTFRIDNISEMQVSALITGIRYIGYDSKGNDIKYEMPSFINNELIWKFLIRDDGWD